MTRNLEGKSALVTGGASGIGRATALAFAREGARVAVADILEEAAQCTVTEIEAMGGQALAIACDVTDDDAVKAMIAATVDAGWQKIADVAPEAWRRLIDVNLTGVWLCLRHEVAQMRAQGSGGVIINTASILGLVGSATSSAYVAAKHGVVGLTKTAAADHAEDNIRVNAVCPGYIETPMTDETMRRRGGRILARVPMARMGKAREIAEAVVWLCSPKASFVTGVSWAVDGGYTAI